MPRREREKYFAGFRMASHAESYLYGEPQRALYSRSQSDRSPEARAYWQAVCILQKAQLRIIREIRQDFAKER
jgi:hypothetical protein